MIFCCFFLRKTGNNLDTCLAQLFKASSIDPRILIIQSTDDPHNTGTNQSFTARGRLPNMGTWLQGYIGGCPACQRPCLLQGYNFGMRATAVSSAPPSNDAAAGNYDTAHARIGPSAPQSATTKRQSHRHELKII
jgi:hypothetical protein